MNLNWKSSFRALSRLEFYGAGLNKWERWVSFFVSPVAYFAILGMGLSGVLGGADYLAFVGPGIIVMQALSALSQMIYRVVIERRWGLAAMKLQAGVPLSSYFLSLLVPRVLVYIVQGLTVAFCMLMSGTLHSVTSILFLLLGVLGASLCSVFWCSVGIIITSIVTNYQTRDFIVSIMMLPLTFSAPVFYRLENAPRFVQLLSTANPLTYQVEWVRGICNGDFGWTNLIVVLLTTMLIGVLSFWTSRKLRIASFEG